MAILRTAVTYIQEVKDNTYLWYLTGKLLKGLRKNRTWLEVLSYSDLPSRGKWTTFSSSDPTASLQKQMQTHFSIPLATKSLLTVSGWYLKNVCLPSKTFPAQGRSHSWAIDHTWTHTSATKRHVCVRHRYLMALAPCQEEIHVLGFLRYLPHNLVSFSCSKKRLCCCI